MLIYGSRRSQNDSVVSPSVQIMILILFPSSAKTGVSLGKHRNVPYTNIVESDSRMETNAYHFITVWHMPARPQEVVDILSDAESLPRWWPSVYLRVTMLDKGREDSVGRRVDLHTRGWLPYTLRWQFQITEANLPHGFALEAHGDFEGRGVWAFEPEGDGTKITYDWRIHAEKPLLKYLSFIFKPLFGINHRWAMQQGEISLRRELERRRGR